MEIYHKLLNMRLKFLRSDIDSYIAAHYFSPYDDDMYFDDVAGYTESPCADATQIKDTFNRKIFFTGASPLCTTPAIDDILKQQSETFSQMLLRLIDEKNLKDSEVYKNANIDRRLFSKIRGDKEYIPSKKTTICFCMALKLDIVQSKKLLEAAGYALSTSSKFDLIVMYLLEKKEYNVTFANIILENYGESCLTR